MVMSRKDPPRDALFANAERSGASALYAAAYDLLVGCFEGTPFHISTPSAHLISLGLMPCGGIYPSAHEPGAVAMFVCTPAWELCSTEFDAFARAAARYAQPMKYGPMPGMETFHIQSQDQLNALQDDITKFFRSVVAAWEERHAESEPQ